MTAPHVLTRLFAPMETDYLQAVRADILELQTGYTEVNGERRRHTQKYIAERCGISAKTIQGAQEMRHALKGWVVCRLAFEFGDEAVARVRALGGVSVSPDASADTIIVARIRSLVAVPEDAGERRAG